MVVLDSRGVVSEMEKIINSLRNILLNIDNMTIIFYVTILFTFKVFVECHGNFIYYLLLLKLSINKFLL